MARPYKHLDDLEHLADMTYNRFTVAQAVGVGIPERTLWDMSRPGGPLERIGKSVLALSGRETSFRARARTGLLIAGPGSLGARRTAARLLGADGCDQYEPVDIFHPNPRKRSELFVPSRALILPEDVMESYGIPHSNALCTLAQVGSVWPAERVERMLEWALRNGVAYDDVVGRLGRRGSTGLRTLREVLEGRPKGLPYTHSELETRFWQLIRGKVDPMPDRQVPVRDSSGRILFYLDLAWWRLRLYVELDGVAAHSTPQAIFADRHRMNAITALHHIARLDYTWEDVVKRPAYVIANVRAALATARLAATDNAGSYS